MGVDIYAVNTGARPANPLFRHVYVIRSAGGTSFRTPLTPLSCGATHFHNRKIIDSFQWDMAEGVELQANFL